MAILGFIFACIFTLYFIAAGLFMVVAHRAVCGEFSKIGVIVVAFGVFFGYVTVTNAPFTIIPH